MEYISIKQAAESWGITERQVQNLCKSGKINGAKQIGRVWMIPDGAKKPVDRRTKSGKTTSHTQTLRDNPLLIYTDLYQTAGTADEVIASLKSQAKEARIMKSQLEYIRGNTDYTYEHSRYFLDTHSDFNTVVGAGIQLALCAIWRGDVYMWRKARQHIYEAPCENESDRQLLTFWLAATDSFIYDTTEFPEWFKKGIFDYIPADSFCSARMFYVKYLFICAHELAGGKIKLKDVERFGLMRTMPHIVEPMISQAKIEKTIIPEIYLHLMAATVYHNLGTDDKAIPHIDTAISLCLPDKLYGALVEYRTNLDTLLDDRLALADKTAMKRVSELHKKMISGWIHLHNILLERNISVKLSTREREAARLAAFGFKNKEIAKRMNVSETTARSHIISALNKVGANKTSELGLYV